MLLRNGSRTPTGALWSAVENGAARRVVLLACGHLDYHVGAYNIFAMNYLLAIVLPPLSIILTGHPILGVIVLLIWIPAIIFSGGLTHPMFILLAWFLIFSARERAARARDLRRRD